MKHMTKLVVALSLLSALLFPVALTASAQAGGPYTSGFQLQNLGSATANISIAYYQQSGTLQTSVSDTINTSSSKTYFPLSAVSSGFNGSVVVSSDQPLASIVNVLKSDLHGGAAYAGFTSGATTVNLPLIMKLNVGTISTWYNVQNTGSSAAHITVKYSNHTPACDETPTIQPSASVTLDQSTNACLPVGYVGAATLTSDQPVAVVVMQIISAQESLFAYTGFATSSTNPVMPLISSNFFHSGTGIQIQNTGGSDTNVTLTYNPSAGFPGATCTETRAVPHGQSVTFGFPQLPAACGTTGTGVTDPVNKGFVGSAAVTTNSASMPLAAIVNTITRGTATGDSYDAVNPANATSKVSLPLLMDRNVGTLFTGFSVANVGTSSTNVACTFTGAGAPPNIPSTAVAPGTSLTEVQLGKGTAGYVGSGICTATGGDQKIAAIVNEAATGSPSNFDQLFTYPGINY